jgi:endonuclease I
VPRATTFENENGGNPRPNLTQKLAKDTLNGLPRSVFYRKPQFISFAMLQLLIVVVFACVSIVINAQEGTYYAGIDATLKDDALKGALQNLINPHTVIDYDSVWGAFDAVDQTMNGWPCNASNATFIPDVYSSNCWNPVLGVTGGECGNYKKEGDCFNREHIWPKSWFGGFDNGANAQTDLWELYPSDGYVNGLRGNLPLGPITCDADASYISSNGSKIGPCEASAVAGSGYTGKCFEPETSLKGDIARSYFYLATAYWKKWSCCDTDAVNGSDIKPWNEAILRAWHVQDPVDDSERNKNNVIQIKYQGNRNPFVDHPEWVSQIGDF